MPSSPCLPPLREIPRDTPPGVFLHQCLQQAHITQRRAAQVLDMTPQNLTAILQGRRRLTARTCRLLPLLFPDTDAAYWTDLQARYDLHAEQIRRAASR